MQKVLYIVSSFKLCCVTGVSIQKYNNTNPSIVHTEPRTEPRPAKTELNPNRQAHKRVKPAAPSAGMEIGIHSPSRASRWSPNGLPGPRARCASNQSPRSTPEVSRRHLPSSKGLGEVPRLGPAFLTLCGCRPFYSLYSYYVLWSGRFALDLES